MPVWLIELGFGYGLAAQANRWGCRRRMGVTERAVAPRILTTDSVDRQIRSCNPLAWGNMKHPKRSATALRVAGLALAIGTPAFVAHAVPDLAGSLLQPAVLVAQAVPFVLCAGLWLPWREPKASIVAVFLSGLLLLAALISYVPMLWIPEASGGDMIGVAFLAIAAGITAVLAIGSGVALLVLGLRHRARHRRESQRVAA